MQFPWSRHSEPVRKAEPVREALTVLETVGRDGGDLAGALQQLSEALKTADDFSLRAPDTINRRLASLPFDVPEAIAHMALTRLVNRRVLDGYYRNRLVVLATMEKSSSTLHEVAINEMLRYSGNIAVIMPTPRSLYAGPTESGGSASFSYGLLLHFPNGGVCRGEFEPTWQNRQLLTEMDCPVIVLARHPADRMVAQYCMRVAGRWEASGFFEGTFRGAPISGYPLADNLRWMWRWMALEKVKERILVVRYEDMMADINTHFERIHNFIYEKEMSPELSEAISKHFKNSGEGGSLQPGDASGRVYEKGYSGKVGVWRDYLSDEEIAAYNKTTEQFLANKDDGDALVELYPDILLR